MRCGASHLIHQGWGWKCLWAIHSDVQQRLRTRCCHQSYTAPQEALSPSGLLPIPSFSSHSPRLALHPFFPVISVKKTMLMFPACTHPRKCDDHVLSLSLPALPELLRFDCTSPMIEGVSRGSNKNTWQPTYFLHVLITWHSSLLPPVRL